MSHLVTGDAVVLELQPARLPTRALAATLDWALLVAGYLLLVPLLLSTVLELGSAVAQALQVALLVLVLVGVPVAVETLSNGRSLGKAVCGLRVVRDDGGPIRFRHALVRGAIGFLELLLTLGSVACVASLVSERGRRLGDVFGGTLVVRERIPVGPASALPPPPPEAAGYLRELDLSRVPDGLWLAVRQYLTRQGQLDPRVTASLAARLAADLAERTGSAVPPGVAPGAYVAGVAAERQRRDAERILGPEAAPDAGARPGLGREAPASGWSPPVPGAGGEPGPPERAPEPTEPTEPTADGPGGGEGARREEPAAERQEATRGAAAPRRGFTPPF